MRKYLLAATLFLALGFIGNAQTNLTQQQQGYLLNTWFESPKESQGKNIVYRLTEYTVIVGKDDYIFPPGKVTFTSGNNYTAEYLKLNTTTDPQQTSTGDWKLQNNHILINQNSKLKLVAIESNKLVLEIQ